ncbi:MAG: hypothetical protein MR579_02515 [Bacteroidales bacterium]|nr:hypothetical protein [Bacteroidales bacterium]
MICLVLAGGAGDRLWPLSRKNYPKQFVDLVGSHSLFQEAILRNMPFCEEFWIFTAQKYRQIVRGQLQVFQGLRYRCFCEEEGRRTLPALVLACLCANPSENFLVVSTDHVIEGENYKDAVVQGREWMARGQLCCLGVSPREAAAGCGFLRRRPEGGVDYRYAATRQDAQALPAREGWLWDTGIVMGRAGDFLAQVRRFCPGLCETLEERLPRLELSGRYSLIPASFLESVPSLSIGEALTLRSDKMQLIRGDFLWRRVVDLESLVRYGGARREGSVVEQDCQNVHLLGRVPGKLIVANGLKDISLVDTPDALYITQSGSGSRIKEILAEHPEYRAYFEEGSVRYAPWGTRQRLSEGEGYQVDKLSVFCGRRWSLRPAPGQTCRLTLLKGAALLEQAGKTRKLSPGQGFEAGPGQQADLLNEGEEPLVLLQVCTGLPAEEPAPAEEDAFRLPARGEELIRLEPAFHDNLWGGTRLRDIYHKKCDYERIGESWELSAHEAGQSTVATGRFRGLPFGEYLERIGREKWGWKCQHLKSFPLLIKLIDARQALSIQVHPGDEYALEHENSYGKNEMWHVLDAKPGACLYCGFTRPITRQEISGRIREGTLLEVLRRIPVSRGMTVFIPSGTVHAIGEGILLCEVQQSSDLTYRLYDYGRLDAFGQPRRLHEKQALEVLVPGPMEIQPVLPGPEGEGVQEVCNCKYFAVTRREIPGRCSFLGSEASFTAILFLEGSGTIQAGKTRLEYRPADCFFLPAGDCRVEIEGSGSLLQVQV